MQVTDMIQNEFDWMTRRLGQMVETCNAKSCDPCYTEATRKAFFMRAQKLLQAAMIAVEDNENEKAPY